MPAPFLPNYQTRAARAAGGAQSMFRPLQAPPVAQMANVPMMNTMGSPVAPRAVAPQPMTQRGKEAAGGYGNSSFQSTKVKGAPRKSYNRQVMFRDQYHAGLGRQNYRTGREVGADGAYDSALADPTGTARRFQSFYDQQAQAMASPIMRQFQMAIANNLGTASRFGGMGGSTEQGVGEFNTSDIFSRNLAEVLASNAGQMVNAGFTHTDQLGQRSRDAAGASDRAQEQMFGAIEGAAEPVKQKKGIIGKIAGAVGAVGGAALGIPKVG